MPLLLELGRHFPSDLIEEALNTLLTHHDALRIRFSFVDGQWLQFNEATTARLKLSVVELGSLSQPQQADAIRQHASLEQTKLRLDEAPLMRATLFRLGPARPDRLLLVIHHLVLDITSQRILVADLQRSLEQLENREAISLPQKTSSFKSWADLLSRYANSMTIFDQAPHWLHLFDSYSATLPLDSSPDLNIESTARSVSASLDLDSTSRLLKQVPKAFRTQIHEALVEALGQCICRWAAASTVLIDVEGHGREEIDPNIDLSRTVGWFTAIYPVLVQTGGPLADRLKRIKQQMRGAPLGGIGYGLLKYVTDGKPLAEKLNTLPEAEVSFNYFGQIQQGAAGKALVRAVEGEIGESRSGAGRRRYVIEVEAAVIGGRLVVIWRYSQALHSREEIDRELGRYLEEVKRIAEASEQEQGGGYTPADFPLGKLDKQKLDEALSKVKFEG